MVGQIQLLFSRGCKSQLARGKLSFVTASPKFNQFYQSTNGIMLTVTKTQLIFAPVESLQTKLQTNLCGDMDHLGYPTNRHCHNLQLAQLTFSQYKQTRLFPTCKISNLQSRSTFLEFDRFNSFRKLVRVF